MTRSVAARWVGKVGICLLGTALLSGCGGSRGFEPEGTGAGSTLGNLIAFNKLNPGPAPQAALTEDKLDCPTIEVLDGTASARVYAGADQSNGNVKYQFSMGDVVRECSHVGGDLVLKVGVEGRVLIGPVGAPGSFAAPVRIAVRRERDQTVVASKFYRVPVTVPPGGSEAGFSLVSDPIAVPFTQAHTDEDYTIVVGFDAKGSATADAKPRKVRRRGH
jgi:hypothetical protein